MIPIPLADILPTDPAYYAVLVGGGFLVGAYAHAARMPRLLAFSILLVVVATLLALVVAQGPDGVPGRSPV